MATTSSIFETVKVKQNVASGGIFERVSQGMQENQDIPEQTENIFSQVSKKIAEKKPDVVETKNIEDLTLDELYGDTPIKKGGPTDLTKRVKKSVKQAAKDFTSPKLWAKSAAQVALAPGRIALDVAKLPWAAASATGKAIDLFEDDEPRNLFELIAGKEEGLGKKIQRFSQNEIEYLDRLKQNIKPVDEEMSDTAVSFMLGGAAAAGTKAFTRKAAGKYAETAAKAGLLEPLKVTAARGGLAAAAGDKLLIDPAMKKVDAKLDQTDLSPGAKQIARSIIPIVFGITSGLFPERQLERMLSSSRFTSLLEKSVTNKTLARKLYEEAFETANTQQVKEASKEVTNLYTKHIGEPIWDTLIQKKVPEMLERVPGGKSINRALIYGYRGSLPDADDFTKAVEATRLNRQFGLDYAIDVGNRVNRLPQADQLKIAEYIKGERLRLPENLKDVGDEIRGTFYSLGKQAVESGLLKEDTFFKHAGRYMPRLYETKEFGQLLKKWGFQNPNRLDLSRFKKRGDIPKEIREEMGEILTPGYPAAKGISQLTHDIALSKFFKGVAENPKWVAASDEVPEGFVKLSENPKLGPLKDKYVHPDINTEIEGFVEVLKTPERVWRKALGAWKFGKVILSPKTHARNVISNSFLAHLGGLPMWKQPDMLGRALKEFKVEGDLFVEAKRTGLLESTYTNAELRSMFDQVANQLDATGPLANKITSVGKFTASLRKAGNKAAQAYEAEEQIFKLAKFIDNRGKGIGPQQASEDAEKWLFNYGKLTHFQEQFKSKWYGAPFATFSFKSIPRVMEAAVKTPWRFALPAAMVYGLENAASEKFGDTRTQTRSKKKLAPDWMQGSFLGIPNFARVPVSDEAGREYYLNLSYIFPWGDLGEGGGFGPIPGSLMPGSMPILKEGIQQISGKGGYDWFWGEQIVKDEDIAGLSPTNTYKVQAKKRLRHAYNTMVPTIGIDIEKIIDAYRSNPDYKGRERPDFVVGMDVFAGVKMYPVDYVDQVVRKIYEVSPKNGKNARILKRQIRSLERRARAVEDKDQDGSRYRKQIDEKIEQIKGLAREAMEVRDTYYETQKKEKSIFEKVKESQKPKNIYSADQVKQIKQKYPNAKLNKKGEYVTMLGGKEFKVQP